MNFFVIKKLKELLTEFIHLLIDKIICIIKINYFLKYLIIKIKNFNIKIILNHLSGVILFSKKYEPL